MLDTIMHIILTGLIILFFTTGAYSVDFSFRAVTYNVLSDAFKRDYPYVKSLKEWGDCKAQTRCFAVKSTIQSTNADIIALQEIPRDAYNILKSQLPGFDGEHVANARAEGADGVAILWRSSMFSLANKDAQGNKLTEEKFDGTVLDNKPALVLFLAHKNIANIVIGTVSSHFGDSVYAKNPEGAGVGKMNEIITFLDKHKTSLNMILGDFNEDQKYNGDKSKLAIAKQHGYESGAKTDNAITELRTDPNLLYELWPPRRALDKTGMTLSRVIDWGLFKANAPFMVDVKRLHGEFDDYKVIYDKNNNAQIQKGELVLSASDHLPVVFEVRVKTGK